MPLGIVDASTFEKDLIDSSLSNDKINELKSGQVIDIPHKGRSVGDNNVPSSLRKIIGEESNINGRTNALTIAKSFGISPSSASAYNNGATSTDSYHTPSKDLSSHITNAKMKVTKRAMSRLLKSMNYMTDDKFESASLIELASVAKNMSGIVTEFSPNDDNNDKIRPTQFIVMAPQIINENKFDVVYAKE